MRKIHLIEGYSKIAAGEVIERPASVVKELLENALDAEADQIFITIENAGKNLIQIQDNGKGINEDDMEIAFQSHTSSKIKSADELDNLHTLGFRGEALASIAAISQIEIISHPAHQDYGKKLEIFEGKIKNNEQCGAPVGTTIKVANLFFNLPVRKKFMRSNRVELGHITDVLTRYSLAYPKVHFKLIHNSIVIINSPAWSDQNNVEGKNNLDPYKYAIQTIYGKNVSSNLIPIHFNDGNIKLNGFIGSPEISRSDKSAASLFVNKRLVTNNKISQLIINSYKDYLMRNRFPFYIIYIDVPPNKVDFNIHPSKKTVKFEDESKFLVDLQIIINDLIIGGFKQYHTKMNEEGKQKSNKDETIIDYWTLSNPKIIKPDLSPTPPLIMNSTKSIKSARSQYSQDKKTHKTTQSHFKIGDNTSKPFKPSLNSVKDKKNSLISSQSKSSTIKPKINVTQLPPLNILNSGIQAGKNYLIFQNDEELVLIDQHAAHERINYEKVQEIYNSKTIPIQTLLVPLKMEVSPNETEFIKEAIPEMKTYGFEIEHFGRNTFIIRTIPVFINMQSNEALIKDMCMEILNLGKEHSFSEKRREILQFMGCHKSITAGDEIWSEEKIRNLIQQLDSCENPHACAHGRPVYIKIPFKELDKWFHRTT
nr:DNA mismatch repair endonuclease MutL [Candidatus Prometheoarchaeum syntrophicum]QEE14387.1 DNA mismatch repair protein [Candidatus Prometheoarchaeum syntrophicum]